MDGGGCGLGHGAGSGEAVGGWGFVGAGVEGDLPLALHFLPDGDVAAGERDWLAVLALGGCGVVSPGEAGERVWSYPGRLRRTSRACIVGVPVGDGGDGDASADGGLAVGEGDAVVGEPGAEGAATFGGDVVGELAFELEELELAGGEGGMWRGVKVKGLSVAFLLVVSAGAAAVVSRGSCVGDGRAGRRGVVRNVASQSRRAAASRLMRRIVRLEGIG